jgi:hypothetical protein
MWVGTNLDNSPISGRPELCASAMVLIGPNQASAIIYRDLLPI